MKKELSMSKKPVLLCIMDGYGMPETTEGNAIAAANKPNLDALIANFDRALSHPDEADLNDLRRKITG